MHQEFFPSAAQQINTGQGASLARSKEIQRERQSCTATSESGLCCFKCYKHAAQGFVQRSKRFIDWDAFDRKPSRNAVSGRMIMFSLSNVRWWWNGLYVLPETSDVPSGQLASSPGGFFFVNDEWAFSKSWVLGFLLEYIISCLDTFKNSFRRTQREAAPQDTRQNLSF